MSSTSGKAPQKRYCYDYHDPLNALAFNAVATISMIATSERKSPVLCEFRRANGTPNKPLIFDHRRIREEGPPSRLPSKLPPPGHLLLHLQIQSKFGRGRAGGIYGVAIDFNKSSPEISTLAVPPLVAKISRPGQHARVKHEAYYYEEMECLQGIVIPRCYGLFTGEIPTGFALFPEESSEDTLSDDTRESTGSDSDAEDDCTSNIELNRRLSQTLPGAAIPVSILLLEQLGDRLPVGKELPEDINAEVLDMYSHLAELGIDHVDIRHANLLEVLPCPPGWPSLISPMTQNPYRFRIIDFDNSRKTNRSVPMFAGYHRDYVVRMLDGLRYGYIIEPWDF